MTTWLAKLYVGTDDGAAVFTLDLQGVWSCDRPDAGRCAQALEWLNACLSPGTSRSPAKGYAGAREARAAAGAMAGFPWVRRVTAAFPPRPKESPDAEF